jgi:hypothetical protein
VTKQLAEKGISALHTEDMTPYEMILSLAKAEEAEYQKKQKEEYEKMLDEVNSWNSHQEQ